MNHRKPFRSDRPIRERIYEVDVGRRHLTRGITEVRLGRATGRKAGWYRFDWAERRDDGGLELNVYGPLRAAATAHYRTVLSDQIKGVRFRQLGDDDD